MTISFIVLLAILWVALYEIARMKTQATHRLLALFVLAPFIHILYLIGFGLSEYTKDQWLPGMREEWQS